MSAQTAAALAKKQTEIHAAMGVVASSKEPVVPAPQIPVPRPNKRSFNVHGCVITSETHGEQLAANKQAAKDAATAKTTSSNAFWESRRAAVRAAEAALVEAGSDPAKIATQKQLADLIISRTNHLPKAKNNAVADGETEGARLKEARSAMAKQKSTLMPPTPSKDHLVTDTDVAVDDADATTGGVQEAAGSGIQKLDGSFHCEGCLAPIYTIGHSSDAADYDARYGPDETVWCNQCSSQHSVRRARVSTCDIPSLSKEFKTQPLQWFAIEPHSRAHASRALPLAMACVQGGRMSRHV